MTPSAQPLDSQFSAPGAVLVAHPGHELRVHGFLERYHPVVFVITDGSQRSECSRLPSTAKVIRGAGCRPGRVFGPVTDGEIYEWLLAGSIERFVGLVDMVAADLASGGVEWIAGDAVEGYNPSHDVCNALMRAAVRIAERESSRAIACYEFPLVGPPDGGALFAEREGAIRWSLDDAGLERKLAAALGYPELADEVERQLASVGEDEFREEWMWPVDLCADGNTMLNSTPFYERHGQDRVREGHYREVITYRKHLAPVVGALGAHAANRADSSRSSRS